MCFPTVAAVPIMSSVRLNSFDYFRAIAIVLIVTGHCIGPWLIDSFVEMTLANLICGGSTLFVFISGFFFHRVYYPRFDMAAFMGHKVRRIAIPYTLLTLAGFLLYTLSSADFPYQQELMPQGLADWKDRAWLLLTYLATGRIATAYWYIPFAMLLFSASPLFIRFIRAGFGLRTALIALWLPLALIIQRPLHDLSPVHALLYFVPVYLLGIQSSLHWDAVQRLIRGRAVWLGSAVVILAALQTALTGSYGGLAKPAIFSWEGLDIILLQKILLCYFLLAVLLPLEKREIPVLKLLASASFAIYFLHPWVLLAIWESHVYDVAWFVPGFGDFILTIPVALLFSLLIAYLIRRLLKSRSHYVTGW